MPQKKAKSTSPPSPPGSEEASPGQVATQMALLAEIGASLTTNLDLNSVLQSIAASVAKLLRYQNWSLLLLDEARQDLYFEIAVGDAAEQLRDIRVPVGEGIAGWVAKHHKPLRVDRVQDDARFDGSVDKKTQFSTGAILCLPLICRNHLLGVIEFIRSIDDPEPFTQADEQITVPFAAFVAVAIDNARSFRSVEELTVLDALTGLHNSRFLSHCAQEETARAMRYGRALSFIFIDLDGFKQVNDTQGHHTGSEVLRRIGRFLYQVVRETDRCIRYGGDEFVLVCPETGKEGALALAERVRCGISELPMADLGIAIAAVTASIGIATFPNDGDNTKTLLEQADRAMYAAKKGGKNQIVDASQMDDATPQPATPKNPASARRPDASSAATAAPNTSTSPDPSSK